ncbi:hypothetical protein EC9_16370 [Rosistilla ulvae]|uniref:Uncharacterized protein n=1 Tax=Rosistilla ulvae TaxID=1930277 RepID=A0A517LXW7_9BACT|nr:hypothetical protein EC9_16370 [Rosistilla ulvae]
MPDSLKLEHRFALGVPTEMIDSRRSVRDEPFRNAEFWRLPIQGNFVRKST